MTMTIGRNGKMNKWQETKIIFYMFVEFAICTVVLFLDVLYYFITGKERN